MKFKFGILLSLLPIWNGCIAQCVEGSTSSPTEIERSQSSPSKCDMKFKSDKSQTCVQAKYQEISQSKSAEELDIISGRLRSFIKHGNFSRNSMTGSEKRQDQSEPNNSESRIFSFPNSKMEYDELHDYHNKSGEQEDYSDRIFRECKIASEKIRTAFSQNKKEIVKKIEQLVLETENVQFKNSFEHIFSSWKDLDISYNIDEKEREFQAILDRLLICSISYEQDKTFRLILDNKDPSDRIDGDALILAAKKGKTQLCRLLSHNRFNTHNKIGEALVCAAQSGFQSTCDFLLSGENPPQAIADSSKALRVAAKYGHFILCKFLLEDSRYSARADDVQSDVLIQSVLSPNEDESCIENFCELCLKAESNPAQADAQESLALFLSAKYQKPKLVKLFLKYGANAGAQNSRALVEAAKSGNWDVCELLLNQDKNPADVSHNNYEAFYQAVKARQYEVFKNLTMLSNEQGKKLIPLDVLNKALTKAKSYDQEYYGYQGTVEFLDDLINCYEK